MQPFKGKNGERLIRKALLIWENQAEMLDKLARIRTQTASAVLRNVLEDYFNGRPFVEKEAK